MSNILFESDRQRVGCAAHRRGISNERIGALLRTAVAATLAICVGACGRETAAPSGSIAVLSAFPAEMVPLLAQATITHTETIGDRVFRVGTLGGAPVVLGITGIGLVNAGNTTRTLIERFEVRGIVVSAVAGSPLQIGDVTVPTEWRLDDGTAFIPNRAWLDVADSIAASSALSLERCTVTASTAQSVCMLQQPVVVVGGFGLSKDPFGSQAVGCIPNDNDLYGCDVPSHPSATASGDPEHAAAVLAALDAETPVANDMETAAIAREATAHNLPFIAFRAVSDGGGDPLNLPGFLPQFAAYYRFAARNAATATVAFLERIAARR